MRAMLDGLMGSARNMTEDEKVKNKRSFDDRDVDTSFLCGCSPWYLLSETKSEGMLPKEGWNKAQDDFLRREWEELAQEEKDKYGFEYDTMKLLEDLVSRIERKILQNKQKVSDEEVLGPEVQKQVAEIDQAVIDLQQKAEELGEQGDVDGALNCIAEADTLKGKREEVVEENKPKARRGLVCDVTGAVISEGDRLRLEEGRMYVGWSKIKSTLKGYQERVPPPQPKPRKSFRGRDDEKRQAERSTGRDDKRDDKRDEKRDDNRERSRSRGRDSGCRDSGRDRGSDRDRRRSRSRSRGDDRRRDDRRDERRRDDRRR